MSITAEHQAWVMEDGERAATYFKTLIREGVSVKAAIAITCAWVLGNLRAESEIRLPPDEWEKGVD